MVVDVVVRTADGGRCVDIRSLRYVTMGAQVPSADESASVVWSQIPPENRVSELESRLQAIVAHELDMSASAVEVDRAFPELGLDSTMAMAVLRGTNRLVGFEVSATMLWDHPSIASLAGYLAELLAVSDVSEGGLGEDVEPESGSAGSVLDELFDSVESA
jgi:acyl carrier protein